jgi:predicted nucleic acid-binding protein
MRYFDSGVLLKLYVPESRTPEATQYFRQAPALVPFTPLHGVEMRSAIRQKVGRGEISAVECARLLQAVDYDLASGVYSTPTIAWPDVYLEAETLSAAHTVSTLCRSLDILHIALAVVLGASEFCTFDVRQARMAKAAGISVVP